MIRVLVYDTGSGQQTFSADMEAVPRVGDFVQANEPTPPKRYEVLQVLWNPKARPPQVILSTRLLSVMGTAFPTV